MSLLAEAARAAGNVLVTPVILREVVRKQESRTLIVGSRNPASIEAAEAALREVAPDVIVEVAGRDASAKSLLGLRRRRYDVVCLMLTGEGFLGEKLRGLLAGAETVVAYGANASWYRVNLPPVQLLTPRWWARAILSCLLCLAYVRPMVAMAAVDRLRTLLPLGRPPAEPGAPAGRQVTFIVPTYNQRELMDFCLPPLLEEAGREHTVMLVDDASRDDTANYVRQKYPQVRLVRLTRNQGFAGAVSAGIRRSKTPLFSLINTDVQVRAGFLSAILPHFDDPQTLAVCSQIELPGGSQMETGNVAPAWSGVLEPYHVPPTSGGPILYAGGASSVYDRAKYEALGGFEKIYRPLYFEDIELGYRAWRRGWESLFEPEASVFHKHRAWVGTRYGNAFANETFLRNGLLFVWKNVRDRTMLAQHFSYVCARLTKEVLNGEGTMARAVLRALPFCGWMIAKRWGEYRRGDRPDRDIISRARPPAADEFVEAGAQ